MSIKEWKPEYERLSTDKLRLLGVEVEAVFESGMRIVKIKDTHIKKLDTQIVRLINIPENHITKEILDTNQDSLSYNKYYDELDLYEIGGIAVKTIGNEPMEIYKGLLVDGYGNILLENIIESNNKALETKEAYYEDAINRADIALARLERYLKDNYKEIEDTDTTKHLDTYFKTYKHSRYIVLQLNYDGIFSGVLVYDTKLNKPVLKSTAARIISPVVYDKSNRKNRITTTTIMTGEKALLVMNMGKELKVYELHEKEIEKMYKEHGLSGSFLKNWRERHTLLDNRVVRKIEMSVEKEGYRVMHFVTSSLW